MKSQNTLTPEDSLRTIHDTMTQAQSAMFLAGTSAILLLWGGVVAVGYIAEFLIANYATEFADNSPVVPCSSMGLSRGRRYDRKRHHRIPGIQTTR